MTTRYLRSTDGSDSDDGSTWALAKAKLASASGIGSVDAAGDIIYISQSHAETTSSAFTYTGAGTVSNPQRLLCGNDAAEPPTALATGAVVECTSTSGTSALNGSFYAYGITWRYAAVMQFGAGNANCFQFFDNCTFDCTGAGSSGHFDSAQDNDSTRVVMNNCSFKFANSANYIQLGQNFEMRGGTILSGTSTPNPLFKMPTDRTMTSAIIDGVDFSNFASTLVLFSGAGVPAARTIIRNCKLPSSWSGTLTSATPPIGQRFEMYNCSASGTNYAVWIEDYCGTVRHETTIIKTGGASNGTTGISFKMTTTANTTYPGNPMRSQDMVIWNETTGSSLTATIDIVHDSVTNLTDGEVWIELEYLGTSGGPVATFITDAKTDVLASAADQASSSVTWTTTGLTNPNKQKLNVSFTPQLKGLIMARVVMSKASKTIYFDPVLQVA